MSLELESAGDGAESFKGCNSSGFDPLYRSRAQIRDPGQLLLRPVSLETQGFDLVPVCSHSPRHQGFLSALMKELYR
jgi:hypothetical protein